MVVASAAIGSLTLSPCAWAALAGQPAVAAQSPSPRLFAPASVWNTPTASLAGQEPDRAIVKAFHADVRRQLAAGIGPWINSTRFSTPIFVVPAQQARIPVELDSGAWADPLRRQLAPGVPIPTGAMPAKGTDAHLTVWQPSTDTLWEFWGTSRQADGWHARWGGVMRDVSRSPGHYRDRRASDGTIVEQRGWGGTATSLPVAAGTVTIVEARRGRIKHALALNVPNTCAKRFVPPAQRTDGTSMARDCMPAGARLRLDPSFDVEATPMPRFTRTLARAAQRYGVIVRDTTDSVTAFSVEDPSRLPSNPWTGTNGSDGLMGGPPWRLVAGQFPWGRLQLLKAPA